MENRSRGESGDVERSLNLETNLSYLRFLTLSLTHSLLMHAHIVPFYIAIYTLVPLLLVLRLLLASLLEIVFNSVLFAIIL